MKKKIKRKEISTYNHVRPSVVEALFVHQTKPYFKSIQWILTNFELYVGAVDLADPVALGLDYVPPR